jgi:ABC-type Mn2+/Zn2+ transport system ATPase subunit
MTHTHDTTVALHVDGLSAGYPGDRYAISKMSFSIPAGERVALIGPNGAGKSTLFKAIAGLIPFTTGEISVNGHDCRSSHVYVGYVPQQSDIDWSFPVSVVDVVVMGFARENRWIPWTRRADLEQAHALLEQLSLTHLAHRQISELSGGQRRRVFIARALAQKADVLLMDEPFTGVDGEAAEEIVKALDMLTNQGITILLATHDLQRAGAFFDRVLLIRRKILADGPPSAVLRGDVLRQAYTGALSVMENGQATMLIADEHAAGD